MNNGVYKILNVLTGDCYIGSCASKHGGIEQRWRNHVNSLRKNTHHSTVLQRAWNKYGEASFKFDILEKCDPDQCISREQHYLDGLCPKYNILKIAGSSLGRVLSPEHIKKLKSRSYDWMRGDNNWNKDPSRKPTQRKNFEKINIRQYITDESHKKISEYHKGRPKPVSHRKKISAALCGIVRTDEHQRKLNAAHATWAKQYNSGENNYFHTHAFRGKDNANFSGTHRFRNKLTGEEFVGSKIELCNIFGLDHSKVCAICNGKRKSHKKWTFINKENSYETSTK